MRGKLILADYADEQNGKLFVSGGGWARIKAGTPVNIALAVVLVLEPDELTTALKLSMPLTRTDTGAPALDAASQPIMIQGVIEASPKPQVEAHPAIKFNLPLAIRVPPQVLEPGHYRWDLLAGDELLDSAEFDAIEGDV